MRNQKTHLHLDQNEIRTKQCSTTSLRHNKRSQSKRPLAWWTYRPTHLEVRELAQNCSKSESAWGFQASLTTHAENPPESTYQRFFFFRTQRRNACPLTPTWSRFRVESNKHKNLTKRTLSTSPGKSQTSHPPGLLTIFGALQSGVDTVSP